MEYIYRISSINEKERWIYISSNDEFDLEEPDAFAHLVQRIRRGVSGTIKDIGNMRYKIENDELDLIYQWDSCFGITVIYPSDELKDAAKSFLQQFL